MEPPTIVLGLGNPGRRYETTRHNLGFRVIDRLARHAGAQLGELAAGGRPFRARGAEVALPCRRMVLAKPTTYMNRSGRAALALCHHYAAGPDRILVVHDDADLRLGRLRIRSGGRAGGHNGLRSLIEVLGSQDFPRVKLGVRGEGRQGRDLADYVLEPFEPEEAGVADRLVRLGAEAVETVVREGLDIAMNRYNGCDAAYPGDEVTAGEE